MVAGCFMFVETKVIIRGSVMREMRIKQTKKVREVVREQSLLLNVCWVIHSLSARTQHVFSVSG